MDPVTAGETFGAGLMLGAMVSGAKSGAEQKDTHGDKMSPEKLCVLPGGSPGPRPADRPVEGLRRRAPGLSP